MSPTHDPHVCLRMQRLSQGNEKIEKKLLEESQLESAQGIYLLIHLLIYLFLLSLL